MSKMPNRQIRFLLLAEIHFTTAYKKRIHLIFIIQKLTLNYIFTHASTASHVLFKAQLLNVFQELLPALKTRKLYDKFLIEFFNFVPKICQKYSLFSCLVYLLSIILSNFIYFPFFLLKGVLRKMSSNI